MSAFTAIRLVSENIQELLEEHVTNSSEPLLTGVTVALKSPHEMLAGAAVQVGISVWLYYVRRNADVLGRTPPRTSADLINRTPVPLDLFYLITPISGDAKDEHAWLGRIIQVLDDHSIVRGADLKTDLRELLDELHVHWEPLPTEEMIALWHTVQKPMRTSLCYCVQIVPIGSDHEAIRRVPVEISEERYSQILSVS